MSYPELADQLRYPEDPAMQEIYVQTFEFNPACTLEIGWHLFGENYQRGEFLVRIREELRQYEIAESAELPDHLTHVLRLIGRMEQEPAARLARKFVLPALAMVKIAEDNPYQRVLESIRRKLEADFGEAEYLPQRTELPIFQEAGCE